jgi:tRNA dimethylallyltransferase
LESIIARPVVLIAGATATGKSALALKLARACNGVVVNADSQQLYHELRILTARPSAEDEADVPHRLYGVADAGEAWSVGRWLRAVERLTAEEDRPLVIVGGTGLYFLALARGLAPTPQVDPAVRAEVQAAYDAEGEAATRIALQAVDPAAAERIQAGDRQRLVRALAVARSTGRSLSDWRAAPTRPFLEPGKFLSYVVERPREDLYARCDARVEAMMAAGALDEVSALLDRQLDPDLPLMKAVGVRELGDHLRGDLSLADAVDRMKVQTRRYAKRQLTWFRNQNPDWPRLPVAATV